MAKRIIIMGLVIAMLCSLATLAGCIKKTTTYKDGTFEAVSTADDHGYATAKVTIKGDKITAVDLKEFTEKAVEKDYATYPYPLAKEAKDTLTKAFVEKNGPDVDNIAKATGTCNKFKDAVSKALEKAKVNPTVTTKYFDGTFMGRSKADDHGYGVVWVTIKNDKITEVKLEEITEKNEFKDWKTYQYKQAVDARETLQKQFVEKNGPDVDVIAGATSSCNKWKEAVTNALAAAKVK